MIGGDQKPPKPSLASAFLSAFANGGRGQGAQPGPRAPAFPGLRRPAGGGGTRRPCQCDGKRK